jgi:hypothetical protein
MSIPTVAVTCIAYDQNGNPVIGGLFRARLDRTETYNGFVVPEQVTGTADANGVAVLQLWPNALGVAGSSYRITAINPDTRQQYLNTTAVVPNSACNLHEIIVAAPFPPVDASEQALIAAQGALALVTAQAGIATNAATEAEGHADDAQDSATAAQGFADDASNSFTDFDKRYLGTKASDPIVDNEGNALQIGALYYRLETGLRIYDGNIWSAAYISEAGTLTNSDIGITVQAYSENLDDFAAKTAPAGEIVGTTDIQTLSAKSISGTDNTLTSIANTSLVNSAVTVNGQTVALGTSTTVTATATNPLTIGTGLNGSSYNGSAPVTVSLANTTVTPASYGSAGNTLTATVNAQGQLTALAATPIAIANTQVSGLGTASVLDAAVALGTATLDAGGKVPLSQIPASIQGGVSYQGTWDATTNTPTLVSGTGSKGHYYVVSVGGSTNIDGISDWLPSDWIIFNGTAWEKIDNTDSVTSVNGYIGAVSLNAADVGAPPTTRTITAGTGLTGGGDLSANRTIEIDSTVATLTGTQTLTNKTLTSPSITTPTGIVKGDVGLGNVDNTSDVTKNSATATLTNKTINLTDNTLQATSAQIAAAVTDETGTGALVFANSPTLVTPNLGTPASGVVTNLTGTASININGTVGATTASTGAFTTLAASGDVTLSGGTANGVSFLNASKVLTTGSALTFSQSGGTFSTTFNINSLLGSPTYKGGIVVTEDDAAFTLYGGSNYKLLETQGFSTPTALKFFANNAEQMRLTSTGLGIGTSSPGYKLQVDGASTAGFVTSIVAKNPSTNAASAVKIGFDGGGTVWGELGVSYNSNDPYMAFFVRAGSEKMRITDSGNLGIGTSSPAGRLQIRTSAGGVGLVLDANTSDSNSNSPVIDFRGEASAGQGCRIAGVNTGTFGRKALVFYTSDTQSDTYTPAERMRIDSFGNVGIGTSSPTQKLHVAGVVLSKAAGNAGRFDAQDTNSGGAIITVNSALSGAGEPALQTQTNHPILFAPNNTERMRLDSPGNLGLGVTPSAWAAGFKAMQIGDGAAFWAPSGINFPYAYMSANQLYDSAGVSRYIKSNFATWYIQETGSHKWMTAPSGTAGDAISFTQALTLTAEGNLVAGATTSSFRINATVASGADRDIFLAGVSGVTNGFTVKWNHSTTTTRVNILNLPTSSAGLAAGDLYNDSGTLKVA